MKADGSGRGSFTGVFSRRPALALAAFAGSFFWADEVGLWHVRQEFPEQKDFISPAELPVMAIHHQQQQPQGQ